MKEQYIKQVEKELSLTRKAKKEVAFRRMGRQHDFRSDHAALFGVVADFSIVAAVKTLPGSIGCAGNGALTGAALDPVSYTHLQILH